MQYFFVSNFFNLVFSCNNILWGFSETYARLTTFFSPAANDDNNEIKDAFNRKKNAEEW